LERAAAIEMALHEVRQTLRWLLKRFAFD
jgi:hypothetical protein